MRELFAFKCNPDANTTHIPAASSMDSVQSMWFAEDSKNSGEPCTCWQSSGSLKVYSNINPILKFILICLSVN